MAHGRVGHELDGMEPKPPEIGVLPRKPKIRFVGQRQTEISVSRITVPLYAGSEREGSRRVAPAILRRFHKPRFRFVTEDKPKFRFLELSSMQSVSSVFPVTLENLKPKIRFVQTEISFRPPGRNREILQSVPTIAHLLLHARAYTSNKTRTNPARAHARGFEGVVDG
jgi:hypothetical protein